MEGATIADTNDVGSSLILNATPSPEPGISKKQPKSPARKNSSKKKKIARPMNSFMIFAREFRAEMREKYPDIDNKDISKMLGKEWKTLSDERKQTYFDKAAAVAEQHKKDHPDWKFVRAPPRKGKGKKYEQANENEERRTSTTPEKSSQGLTNNAAPFFEIQDMTQQQDSSVNAVHLESLRDLQVAQSRLMMEQQEMEIAVMMAKNCESPQIPPPRYISPPPLKEIVQDSVYLSSKDNLMVGNAPSAVQTPSVHPV